VTCTSAASWVPADPTQMPKSISEIMILGSKSTEIRVKSLTDGIDLFIGVISLLA
jgi:hypothetical protein